MQVLGVYPTYIWKNSRQGVEKHIWENSGQGVDSSQKVWGSGGHVQKCSFSCEMK